MSESTASAARETSGGSSSRARRICRTWACTTCARAYSAATGRFVQADPILHAGGMNLYAYVGNDPLNFTDPWGLQITTSRPCRVVTGDDDNPPLRRCEFTTNPPWSRQRSVGDFLTSWQARNDPDRMLESLVRPALVTEPDWVAERADGGGALGTDQFGRTYPGRIIDYPPVRRRSQPVEQPVGCPSDGQADPVAIPGITPGYSGSNEAGEIAAGAAGAVVGGTGGMEFGPFGIQGGRVLGGILGVQGFRLFDPFVSSLQEQYSIRADLAANPVGTAHALRYGSYPSSSNECPN